MAVHMYMAETIVAAAAAAYSDCSKNWAEYRLVSVWLYLGLSWIMRRWQPF